MYCCLGLFLPRYKTWHFSLLKLEISVCSFVQPVGFFSPLNGSTTIWSLGHSSQLCVNYKLADGVLCSVVQVVKEKVTVLDMVLTPGVHQ